MSTTLSESHVLEDDKTTASAIGAETEHGGSEQAPTEKRNLGDESEEQKPPPLGKQKQKQGGVCECKNGECECEGEGGSEEIGPGTMGCGGGAIDDDDSDEDGNPFSQMLHDLGIAEKWGRTDPVMCCPYPFNALDFKQDTELYNGLKVFGGIAVDYFSSVYNYGDQARFQDIEKVTSCNASCQHCFVILKAKDRSDQVWEIVLRGLIPPDGFAEADPREFHLYQYCYA